MTYEPNPPPDQVEAFQPFGGKPLTLLKVGAGLLARKGQAEPIIEPSPKKRAELETRLTKDVMLEEQAGAEAPHQTSVDELFDEWGGELAPEGAGPEPARQPSAESAPKEQEAAMVRAATAPAAAAVGIELSPAELLRLNVATMRLGLSAPDILAAALEAFLDARKVPSTEACARLLNEPAR